MAPSTTSTFSLRNFSVGTIGDAIRITPHNSKAGSRIAANLGYHQIAILLRSVLLLAGVAGCFGQIASLAFRKIEDVAGLPRVLLIGDSISIGYTEPVRTELKDKANVHRIPMNAATTAVGLTNLGAWLGSDHWDVIHFNFGFHDLKIMDDG